MSLSESESVLEHQVFTHKMGLLLWVFVRITDNNSDVPGPT